MKSIILYCLLPLLTSEDYKVRLETEDIITSLNNTFDLRKELEGFNTDEAEINAVIRRVNENYYVTFTPPKVHHNYFIYENYNNFDPPVQNIVSNITNQWRNSPISICDYPDVYLKSLVEEFFKAGFTRQEIYRIFTSYPNHD